MVLGRGSDWRRLEWKGALRPTALSPVVSVVLCPALSSPELVMASAQGLPGHTQLPGEADRDNILGTVGVRGSALSGEE